MKPKLFFLAAILLSMLSFSAWAEQYPHSNSGFSYVTLAGSKILTSDTLGNFSAVDDYIIIWDKNFSSSSSVGAPQVSGDIAVFSQVTGEITCLHISDGSLIWRYVPVFSETEPEGLNDVAVPGGGKVYAAFTSGKLRAFDIESGKVLWTYESKQGLRTAPAYYDSLVLLGEYNGLFSIIDADTGERINGGGAGGPINTPSVSNGNVYYSAWDGSVHAVQLKNVIPLWNAKLSEPLTTSPVIADGIIIVGTASGKIEALGQNDGAKLWEFNTQGGQLQLSIIDNKVSVLTEDGRTFILEAANGKLIQN